jgi:hypothetical protein
MLNTITSIDLQQDEGGMPGSFGVMVAYGDETVCGGRRERKGGRGGKRRGGGNCERQFCSIPSPPLTCKRGERRGRGEGRGERGERGERREEREEREGGEGRGERGGNS